MKVLLVEHDPMTREMLAAALEGLGYEVHTEPDGLGVERAARMFRPDIALIDLPAGDGSDCIALARRLQAHGDVPLLFLSMAGDVEGVMAAFEVGGDDYLVKPFVMTELVARMRAVLRRSNRTSPAVLQVGDVCVDVASHTIVRSGQNVDLTQREFALLSMLCRRPGAVLSKSQLMAEVWGYEHYDLNVVEVHMSALRRKLEEHGPRLIHTVRGVGYVIRP